MLQINCPMVLKLFMMNMLFKESAFIEMWVLLDLGLPPVELHSSEITNIVLVLNL